jgi:hypothetical protein
MLLLVGTINASKTNRVHSMYFDERVSKSKQQQQRAYLIALPLCRHKSTGAFVPARWLSPRQKGTPGHSTAPIPVACLRLANGAARAVRNRKGLPITDITRCFKL